METTNLEDFYKEICAELPQDMSTNMGHFNVFRIEDIIAHCKKKKGMPYNRRAYYKISFIQGHNKAEYADKSIEIKKCGLLFATPKIPYHYTPEDENQSGAFCVFTADFMSKSLTGVQIDELPIYQPGGYPIFELNKTQARDIGHTFEKMIDTMSSDYAYKYDLLRNYVMELIHFGQQLQPATVLHPTHNAAARVTSLFVELLERQFPIESTQQRLTLRTANDYAERLAVHVNHLNKVLKENTGQTTTAIISHRITQEAKILLRQTNWNISEVAYSLGFEEVAHFSNFFRKQTKVSPLHFRSAVI
jgi:AraC-like DNA-binding protein